MNVLLASYIFYPEPIAMSTIVEDIANELGKEHKVKVVTSYPCRPLGYQLPKKLNKDGWIFERVILESHLHPETSFVGRAKESISFGKALEKYIDDNHDSIDVIYACVQPLFAQKRLVRCAKGYQIPVVIHVEDIYPEPFKNRLPFVGEFMYRLFLPIDKYVLRNASKVVAIAPQLKNYLQTTRNLTDESSAYVYNWQNENRFKDALPLKKEKNKFTFMYLGSLSIAANLLYIAKCFGKAEIGNARFVFAGSGNLKEQLIEIAKEYPNADFEFWEAKGEDVPRIQAQADVLVLPLKKGIALRAFPSKFPAYLFSKRPVLASLEENSDVGCSIKEAHCGWVVNPEDEKELVAKMKEVTQVDFEELKKMGLNGFEYSQHYLTRAVNLKKMVAIIEEAAQKKK